MRRVRHRSRGAVRPAAERRDLRGHALQGAGRGVAAELVALEHADGFRPPLGRARRAFPLAQRDIKRLFAYSSIEHMGIVTFAFGMVVQSPILRRCCT